MESIALAYEPLFRHLQANAGQPVAGLTALARQCGKDPSNLQRDLPKLHAAGLLELDSGGKLPSAITAKAALFLTAMDVADGRLHILDDFAGACHRELAPHPLNPRKDFSSPKAEQKLEELTGELIETGYVIQNLLIRPPVEADPPMPEGVRFWIVAGERRWRAAGRAIERGAWDADILLPAQVRKMSLAEHLRLALVENIQRSDLNPIEEGQVYESLISSGEETSISLAARLNKTDRYIDRRRQLLKCPDIIKEQLVRELITIEAALKSVQTAKPAAPVPERPALVPADRMLLLELAWKLKLCPVYPAERPDRAHVIASGYSYMDESARRALQLGLVEESLGHVYGAYCSLMRLTFGGESWLAEEFPEGVIEADVIAARESAGRANQVIGAGVDEGWYSPVLNQRMKSEEVERAAAVREAPTPRQKLMLAELAAKCAVDPAPKTLAGERIGEGWTRGDPPHSRDEDWIALMVGRLAEHRGFGASSAIRPSADGYEHLKLWNAEIGELPRLRLEAGHTEVSARILDDMDAWAIVWLNNAPEEETPAKKPEAPSGPSFQSALGRQCLELQGEPDADAAEAEAQLPLEPIPRVLFSLDQGDLVSIGGEASGYRLLGRADDMGDSPAFLAQQVSLKTGKDIGKPRTVTLHAIQRVLKRAGALLRQEAA